MSTIRRLVVVGGGMAGLAAAARARERGREVILVEADDRVGGQLSSRRGSGWIHEGGAAVLGEVGPDVERLLESAGVRAERVGLADGASRRYVVHEGRPVPVPVTPGELINSPLLSVAGRLRMLREPFVGRGGSEQETVMAFARRRLGAEAAERLIVPAVIGRGGGDPERLLAGYALRELVEFERRSGSILKGRMRRSRLARRQGRAPVQPWSCANGLGRIPELLAAALGDRVRLGQGATRVERSVSGFRVDLADGTAIDADGVVVAVPANALERLFVGFDEAASLSDLARIRYQPLMVLSLGFRRDDVAHSLDGFGLSLPADSGYQTLSVIFNSSILPGRSPSGTVLMSVMVRAGSKRSSTEPREDLLAAIGDELGTLLGVRAAPIASELFEWSPGSPQPEGEHALRLAGADGFETMVPGITFCGAWHDGSGLADVMAGGMAAVDRLLDLSGLESGRD